LASRDTRPGASLDVGRTHAPSGPNSRPVFAAGRHIGYVYRSKNGEWWAEYQGERRNPIPRKTRGAAEAAVRANHQARQGQQRGEARGPGKGARDREPNILEKRRADTARRSLRTEARAKQDEWEGQLERRMGHLGMRLKAPPPLERRAAREGMGRYRETTAENYDWFYGLSRAEQSRLRSNWMTSDRGAPTPSEVESEMPMGDWLQMTRAIDMSKALQTGRHVQSNRYGGMRPGALIAGEPYEPDEIHHGDTARHVRQAKKEGKLGAHHVGPVNPKNVRRGLQYKEDGSLDVQFFTDDEGRVHPIRASYDTGERSHYGRSSVEVEYEDPF
jgi:hypothetical protein